MNAPKSFGQTAASWIQAICAIVTAVTAVFAYDFAKTQLEQAEAHKQWQNYNDLNSRYAALFSEIPAQLKGTGIASANEFDPKTQNWARRYFDLTSEEYWLHTKRLLPAGMWPCRIAPGIVLNFKEFHNLELAYEHWKTTAVQIHPSRFNDEMAKIISQKDIAANCN